jgi:cytochrome b involved in lipid metabolism
MSKHPGSSHIFLKYSGVDCTKQFNNTKHVDAYNYMDDLCVGKVKY